MKRILFVILVCFATTMLKAQNYDNIKIFLSLNHLKEAKDELDKNMGNAKFTSKAEAWMLKTAIYAGLAMDNSNKNTPAAEQLTKEAETAFKKYKEMDPALSLINDPIYQNGPVNLYSSFYSSGYDDYSKKNWQAGFEKFKKAVELSDLLISKKVVTVTLDTNVLILAGILAENSKNNDDAAIYYSRLADHNIGGVDYESVYRFLVNYYFVKKDIPSFEKYKAMGVKLYPKSEYFTFDKVDFAAGLANGFDAKLKAIQEILAGDPENYKANQVLGEVIFDTLNPRKDNAPLPANAAELEKIMVNAFTKAAALKPGDENPFLFLGDHFIGKAVKINDARTAHAADMKTRTKPGTMPSKEDVAKRDLLDKQYGDALEAARDPYEKAAAIFAGKQNLELRDKQQYKKVVNYLADIYAFKKSMAKGNPAEQAKYAAEEKKWNERYDSIK